MVLSYIYSPPFWSGYQYIMLPVLKVSGWGSCQVFGNVNALPFPEQVVMGAFPHQSRCSTFQLPGTKRESPDEPDNFTRARHSFITAILYMFPLVSMMNGRFHRDASPDYLLQLPEGCRPGHYRSPERCSGCL